MTAGGPNGALQAALGRYSRPSRKWLHLAKRGMEWGARLATAKLRTRPGFVLIGAQRCGTTSLYNYLVELPQVERAFMKETHFFDLYFDRGLNWYRAYFPMDKRQGAEQGQRVTGESTPYYFFHPHTPRRVWEVMPDVKLILMLRNPVDRALSHYHHEVRTGAEERPFDAAIEQEEERLALETARLLEDEGYRSFAHMHHSYLSRGIYVDQLQRWAEYFGRDQMLVLKSEDFYGDPSASLDQVARFLGLPAEEGRSGSKSYYEKHRAGQYAEMDAATRRQLIAYFEPHNQRLYEYLGTDFGWEGA